MSNKMFSKKLERLHKPPCNDLTVYDNEEYEKNELLKLNLSNARKRRHYDYLQQKAAQEKIKLARQPANYLEPIRLEKQSYYIDHLRSQVKKIPVPNMPTSMVDKIKSSTKDLKDMYPEAVDSYMEDLHTDFERTMNNSGMKRILVDPELDNETPEVSDLTKQNICTFFEGTQHYEEEFLRNLFETCSKRK